MKAAISVKSPFSYNALFGLTTFGFAILGFMLAPGKCSSGLQLCMALADISMPERRDDLLGRPMEADSFARVPGNFADSPED